MTQIAGDSLLKTLKDFEVKLKIYILPNFLMRKKL